MRGLLLAGTLALSGCETVTEILVLPFTLPADLYDATPEGYRPESGGQNACSKCSGTGRQTKLGYTGTNRSSSGMVAGSRQTAASGDEACSVCGGSGSR